MHAAFVTTAVALAGLTIASHEPTPLVGGDGWRASGRDAVRGITVGPIENAWHPGVGYGTPAYERTLDECVRVLGRDHPITTAVIRNLRQAREAAP